MVVRAWFWVCRSHLIHGFAVPPYASVAPTQCAAKCVHMHMCIINVDIYNMCAPSMQEPLGTIHGIILALDQSWDASMMTWDEEYMVSYQLSEQNLRQSAPCLAGSSVYIYIYIYTWATYL